MLDDERVMRRSRMWPEEWVGKVTSLERSNISSMMRNDETEGEFGQSMCKLKSPVIMSSDGEELRSSSRVENSVRN